VVLAERQPGGRFAYEYDRAPYPPVVETVRVSLSPGSTLVRDAVKDVIERGELTAMLAVALLEV
jgi:hypothetical protein